MNIFKETAAALALGTLLGSPAWGQCINVAACGVLAAPGNYCAAPNSTFNDGPGDCLVIAAPNVTFSADSLILNGPLFPPGGTGIHILATAPNAVVNLTGNSNIGGSIVTEGLSIGIEDDANNTLLSLQGYVDAQADPAGVTGIGIFLNNAQGTTVDLVAGPLGTTDVQGDAHGIYVLGGGHNVITSNNDLLGDGMPAGDVDASIGSAVLIQNSQHNVINHIFAAGEGDALLVDNSSGNFLYNNIVQSYPYGIRVKWNSPNNIVEHNLIATDVPTPADLFQGTHPNTIGCNGDYWANNTHTPVAALSTNQLCVTAQQALSNY